MDAETKMVSDGRSPAPGLGLCWIVYGIARLLIAVWLVSFTPVATVMFGALLVRVADPYSLMSAFHFFYAFAIVLSVVCGLIGLLAGIALLAGWGSARILAIVAAFLSLSEMPVGLTLSVYTLLRLFPSRASRA
jgi:hypothetical protein